MSKKKPWQKKPNNSVSASEPPAPSDSSEAAGTSSTAGSEQAATVQTEGADAGPKRSIPTLPAVGDQVFVYGQEHDGYGCPATVTRVDAQTGEVNVFGGRRNGQPFGETHVLFMDNSEDPIDALYALGSLRDPKPVVEPDPIVEPVVEHGTDAEEQPA